MPKVAFLSSELRGRPLPKGIVIKIEKTFQSFLGKLCLASGENQRSKLLVLPERYDFTGFFCR